MLMPKWTQDEIERLPKDFTGQIVLECWQGGVTRVDTLTRRQAPKVQEAVRHQLQTA